MTIELWGALAFGAVIGYVTYRTLRRTTATGLGDIAAVIGAVGGGAITALFPSGSRAFGAYGIGLAVGFLLYLIIALIISARTTGLSVVNEWLGEPQGSVGGAREHALDKRRHGIPPIPNE